MPLLAACELDAWTNPNLLATSDADLTLFQPVAVMLLIFWTRFTTTFATRTYLTDHVCQPKVPSFGIFREEMHALEWAARDGYHG